MDRNAIRSEMRRLRQELPPSQKEGMDRCLGQTLLTLPAIRKAKAVYLFASAKGEPDTFRLFGQLLELGIQVAFPRVKGREMEFYWTKHPGELVPGQWGIREPDITCQKAQAADAPVVVPGLAFTREGTRLGYGGGYYDRFFAREPEHWRIALAYPFQVVEKLPFGEWDVPVHQIVTVGGVVRCGRDQEEKQEDRIWN